MNNLNPNENIPFLTEEKIFQQNLQKFLNNNHINDTMVMIFTLKWCIQMQHFLKYTYEGLMVALVIATIVTLWTENTYNSTINTVVWIIFFVDFLIRLVLAKKKWDYIKSNPFLLIAIIPLDQFFQMARIVRLFYLFRIKTIAKYYIMPYASRLTYQALLLFFAIFMGILISISSVVWKMEGAVTTLLDGMFVVFGHLLFFGHRIFIIEHTLSVSLLTVVSIAGVIVQGLALQWVLSKADSIYHNYKRNRQSSEVG